MRRLLMIILALFLFLAMVLLQMRRDEVQLSNSSSENALLIFPKPALVRALSLGHINLIADYYWLKNIQYLGTCIQRHKVPEQIYKYAQFITDLSPRFFEAYYYPAVIMIVYQINEQENVVLLEKGLQNLPTNKDLAFLLGFVYYYFLEDRQKAAEYFQKAYQLSGYGGYALLASRILAEQGSVELSQALLSELAKGSKGQRWSKSIQEMILGLEQRKHLNFLDEKIELYRQKLGKTPDQIQDLIKAQIIEPGQLPQDPFGGHYYIDRATGRAKSTREYYLGVYRPKAFPK